MGLRGRSCIRIMDEFKPTPTTGNGKRRLDLRPQKGPGHPILDEPTFNHLLALERKRSDRSERGLLLALVSIDGLRNGAGRIDPVVADTIFSTLSVALRETDIIGWFSDHRTAAALLTEVGDRAEDPAVTVEKKLAQSLSQALPGELARHVHIAVYSYPDRDGNRPGDSGDGDRALFYPDLERQPLGRKVELGGKRIVDILASASLLTLLAPLLGLIAALVKLTSSGPVFFAQQRVGHRGRLFTFLKFRSMVHDADQSSHETYVSKYIESGGHRASLQTDGIYKLARDERVTPLGRWLRKTSLDELPQLINVVKGEMSLVGPRPPIPYEVNRYQAWHLRRVLEVKPGITGLWQVSGRNRTTFDEMVRLDLQYARRWSLWLDVVLLLRTPWAVIRGDAA